MIREAERLPFEFVTEVHEGFSFLRPEPSLDVIAHRLDPDRADGGGVEGADQRIDLLVREHPPQPRETFDTQVVILVLLDVLPVFLMQRPHILLDLLIEGVEHFLGSPGILGGLSGPDLRRNLFVLFIYLDQLVIE